MSETSTELIKRYLEDAIAAEQTFEDQLRSFAEDGEYPEIRSLFFEHAEETKLQHRRLIARLEALGGSPSGVKSFFAHLFSFTPKTAQIGHETEERVAQTLMIAFAVENSEIAMYEALATVAGAAGDAETEHLAREIQVEEREAAAKVWRHLAPAAIQAFQRVTGTEVSAYRSRAAGAS